MPNAAPAGGPSNGGLSPGPFHPGELAVQARAGVRASAARVGGIIGPTVPPPVAAFLRTVRVVAAGAADGDGRVWATLLVGAPGFVHAPRPDWLHVDAAPAPGDALRALLTGADGPDGGAPPDGTPSVGAAVGLTAVDLATRRRVRVNGALAAAHAGGFALAVEEAYGNCPKYIQARTPPGPGADAAPADVGTVDAAAPESSELSDAQQAWLAAADTAFVASVGLARGGAPGRADASHRGGAPGFLRAADRRRVLLPDYPGNTMFNTLGNLAEDPRVGLAVPDFAGGRLLQLSGTATADWRPEAAAAFPGAERVVVLAVARAREVAGALPAGWSAPRPSPCNPPSR